MSSSSKTKSKRKWNEKNYTAVKVAIKPDIASAFKSACLLRQESQASVISKAMIEYSEFTPPDKAPKINNDDCKYDTRRKRRKAVNDIIKQLEQVLDAEEAYKDNINENFSNRIETAENCIEQLTQAIESLNESYV